MNRMHKLLGIAVLILLVTVLTYAVVAIAPTLITSVGWHEMVSVGWVN